MASSPPQIGLFHFATQWGESFSELKGYLPNLLETTLLHQIFVS
jgi:hypothetical protein